MAKELTDKQRKRMTYLTIGALVWLGICVIPVVIAFRGAGDWTGRRREEQQLWKNAE